MKRNAFKMKTHIGRPLSVGTYINTIMHCTNQAKPVGGHRLVGINIKLNENDVTIVLKKDTPKGPQVAFINAATITYALWASAMELTGKTVRWKEDEWEIRRRAQSK